MIYMSVLNSHLFLPYFSEKSPLFSPYLQYYFTQSPVLLQRCCNMYDLFIKCDTEQMLQKFFHVELIILGRF